jgi:hypothetical protein
MVSLLAVDARYRVEDTRAAWKSPVNDERFAYVISRAIEPRKGALGAFRAAEIAPRRAMERLASGRAGENRMNHDAKECCAGDTSE